MKLRINVCHIYLLVILLCAVDGWLYSGGGFLAQGLQYILILMSLYYTVYANVYYKFPVYFKALNVLLLMFTIYGVLLLINGEQLFVQVSMREVANTRFLKLIYKSLLPIYAFYVFTRKGLLTEQTMKFMFFVFLALTVRSFIKTEESMLREAQEVDSSAEEFTNNVAYTFVGLLPALVLFHKKPIIQYLCLAVCGYFIILGMKRGAMLSGGICLLWFLAANIKKAPKKRRWIIVVVSIIVIVVGVYFIQRMMETSNYFQYRIEQTNAGESSGRDELYATFYNHFIEEDNPFRFLFGYGASATLKIGENFAHNDWLEIATNHGLLGLMVYLVYWIGFYVTWRRTKNHPQAFMAIGMLLIVLFLSTLFSMSYDSVSRCSAMVLGYYLAVYSNMEESPLIKKEPLENTSA